MAAPFREDGRVLHTHEEVTQGAMVDTGRSDTRRRVLDVVGTLVRLGLAAVWLGAGIVKVLDPLQTTVAVAAYQVLPASGVAMVAAVLPWVEIALGLLLAGGLGTRAAAALSAVLLLVFVAGVVQAWARGLSIDCGCFGGGGTVAPGETAYVTELLRDAGLLVSAVWLTVRPGTLFALDTRLAG